MKAARLLTCLTLYVVSLSLSAADNPVTDIESLARQWTSLAQQRSVLSANWRTDRPVLEQQLSLFNRERDTLAASLQETEQAQDEVEERRLELLEEQTLLEQEQQDVEQILRTALIEVRGLHPQLPPPLQTAWLDEIQRLENATLTTSERLQILLDMLTTLDDFRRRVSVNQIVMTMADGQDYLITQIFLGLSAGWYISADASMAATGHPSPSGWQWEPLTDAGEISVMQDILERRRNAGLVSLPVIHGATQ